MKSQVIDALKPVAARFPGLLRMYLRARDTLLTFEEPRATALAFKFSGNAAMAAGSFEPEETRLVERLLPHIDVVINIGANVGYYCCLALREGKQVVAFEPIVLNLQYLLRNIRANGWQSRAEVFPLALSDRVGIAEIYGGGTGASLLKGWAGTPDAYVSLVPTSTLDTTLGGRFEGLPCLILVDIEGAEHLMLEGAQRFLEMSPRPAWLVEIAISEHQPKGSKTNPHLLATFQQFWRRGYEAWTADGTCRLVRPEEIEEIARTGRNTMSTHNFLFLAPGLRNAWLGADA